jgi:hypothetical protein
MPMEAKPFEMMQAGARRVDGENVLSVSAYRVRRSSFLVFSVYNQRRVGVFFQINF